MSDFALDPRIAADTLTVAELKLCTVRLMRDANYPWLLLVPRSPYTTEIVDLTPEHRHVLMDDIVRTSGALREVVACDKLNIASFGNAVSPDPRACDRSPSQRRRLAEAGLGRSAGEGLRAGRSGSPCREARGAFEVSGDAPYLRALPAKALMPSFFDNRIFRESSHLNAFSGNPIERWSEARGEDAFAKAFASEDAAVYLFAEDRALVRFNGEQPSARFRSHEAQALGLDRESLILLGVVEDRPRLAGHIASADRASRRHQGDRPPLAGDPGAARSRPTSPRSRRRAPTSTGMPRTAFADAAAGRCS